MPLSHPTYTVIRLWYRCVFLPQPNQTSSWLETDFYVVFSAPDGQRTANMVGALAGSNVMAGDEESCDLLSSLLLLLCSLLPHISLPCPISFGTFFVPLVVYLSHQCSCWLNRPDICLRLCLTNFAYPGSSGQR